MDLRYALRRLLRSPGFTLVAILSLALGIGANSAMFSLVNALLFRDLNVRDPDRLVEIYTNDDEENFQYATSSYPDYLSIREASRDVFEDVIAYEVFIAQNTRAGTSRMVMGELVSGNYFTMLGVQPALGRGFRPEEDAVAGASPVAVLGHGYWQREFAGDRGVIGRTVQLNRRDYTVIGVAPRSFRGVYPGVETQMYVPIMMTNVMLKGTIDRVNQRGSRSLFMKGRLNEGVTIERAAAALKVISQRLERAYPETNTKRQQHILPTTEVSIHPIADRALVPVAALLLSVVGMVLLIACANLASFLLARAADRRKEIAVRLALGAGRMRLVRQLLVESTLLGVLGGALGLLLAYWMVRALVNYQPPLPIPLDLAIDVDGRVLGFTALVTLVAGLAFGLAPALQATRPQLAPTLRDEAGQVTGTRRRVSLRNGLVVGQVAISLVLLVGSGLFVRSLQKAQHIDPGFNTGAAAILWPNLEMSGYDEVRGRQLQQQLQERLLALPGVTQVALADRIPLGVSVQTMGINIDGVQPRAGRDELDIDFVHIDEHYFEVLGVPVISGRNFTASDHAPNAAEVVLVSEAAARTYWPKRDAVGQTVRLGRGPGRPALVIGVVRDTKVRTLGEAPRPYVYLDGRRDYVSSMLLVVRGNLPENQLLAQARRAVLDLDPQLVLLEAKTMQQHLAIMLYPPRMAALLLSVFGGLALLLAAIGLYGLVSYAVARRTREIGIRMALGATTRDVVGLMTGSGMKLVAAGTVIGLLLALAATLPLSRFLYGIGTLDLATFVAIPAILGSIAFLACYLPARRASRTSPMQALATE